MNKYLAIVSVAVIVLAAGCGTAKKTELVNAKKYEGPFFTISQPEGFGIKQIPGGFAISGKDYGIAIMATKSTKYHEGGDGLATQGEEFLKVFKDGKVEQTSFAGFPALYLEGTSESSVSFGYVFMLEGAMVNINASMVPERSREEAAAILASFAVTGKDYFKPADSKADITQFGPSEGEPLQIDTVMLVPPSGWRILDNSTPDYISIEPKEDNRDDAGMGINILTLSDEKRDPRTIAFELASKSGATPVSRKYGQIEYWTFGAQYQQQTFEFVTNVGGIIHIVTIKTPEDDMGRKMEEFMANLAFKTK